MRTFFTLFFIVLISGAAFAQGTWTVQPDPAAAYSSVWAVNTDIGWACGETGAVVRTTNGGTTWTMANGGLVGSDLYTIYGIDANNAWVGAGDGGLWKTTNGGANWTFVPLTPAATFINIVHFFNAQYGFVQGDPVGGQWRYYITTNGGANWTLPPNTPSAVGTEAGWNNSYGALDTGHIWWGTNASKIWKGSLRGAFTSAPTTYLNSFGVWFNDVNTGIASFYVANAATQNTMRSTNSGTSWGPNGFSTPGTSIIYGLRGVPGTTYYWATGGATTSGNIWRSTDNGTTFVSQLTIPGSYGAGISMSSINHGWAVTGNGLIYKYTDNVGIGNPNHTPTEFSMSQNYPNPFNPTTNIDFNLAKNGYVTLKIYNSLGQEMMTLLDGMESAGEHTIMFNASSLPSGIYFYTMRSGDFVDTKTMVLTK